MMSLCNYKHTCTTTKNFSINIIWHLILKKKEKTKKPSLKMNRMTSDNINMNIMKMDLELEDDSIE